MRDKPPESARAALLLGIVSQLYTTRMTKLLQARDLTLSQFALLNHLARHPKTHHSINDLTEAMEIHQPGVTKIVQKLSSAGFLKVSVSEHDARRREVAITPRGLEEVTEVGRMLYPDVSRWFQGWEPDALEQFNDQLQRLARWLDQNRL